MTEEHNKQQANSGEGVPPQRYAGPGFFGGGMGGSAAAGQKRTWPELVGLTSEEAERRIKEEKPGAVVQIVPEGMVVTMEYRPNRVRIFTGSDGKVARAPVIG